MRGNRRHAASAVDAENDPAAVHVGIPCRGVERDRSLGGCVADRHYGVISIQVLIISGVAMSSSSG